MAGRETEQWLTLTYVSMRGDSTADTKCTVRASGGCCRLIAGSCKGGHLSWDQANKARSYLHIQTCNTHRGSRPSHWGP